MNELKARIVEELKRLTYGRAWPPPSEEAIYKTADRICLIQPDEGERVRQRALYDADCLRAIAYRALDADNHEYPARTEI